MSGIYSKRKQLRHMRRFPAVKSLGLLRAVESVVPKHSRILDLGAASGGFIRQLRSVGYTAFGVDGTKEIQEIVPGLVWPCDLTLDCSLLYGITEWAVFFEVGEHIPKEDEGALLDQVSNIPTDGIIVTWAGVADTGKGHVNCRDLEYVKRLFHYRGWLFSDDATNIARTAGGSDLSRLRRLLVFTKRGI